jgi:hypothetical protein
MAFSLLALVFVVAIIGVNVRNELRATRGAMSASAAADAASTASAPFGGTSSPSVSQFQHELDATMRQVNARAARSGDEADSAR